MKSKFAAFLVVAVATIAGLSQVHAADTYKIDPVHSSILFKVKHLNVGNFYGRFNDVDGTIVFDEANPAGDSVNVEIKTESIDTHNEGREKHLKGADFFDAKQFPTMSFKSKSVEKGKDADSFDISGDFTLHGVTKPMKVTFVKTGAGADPKGGQHIGFEGAFAIKRSDYSMNFMQGPLGDDISIIISIEAGKQ